MLSHRDDPLHVCRVCLDVNKVKSSILSLPLKMKHVRGHYTRKITDRELPWTFVRCFPDMSKCLPSVEEMLNAEAPDTSYVDQDPESLIVPSLRDLKSNSSTSESNDEENERSEVEPESSMPTEIVNELLDEDEETEVHNMTFNQDNDNNSLADDTCNLQINDQSGENEKKDIECKDVTESLEEDHKHVSNNLNENAKPVFVLSDEGAEIDEIVSEDDGRENVTTPQENPVKHKNKEQIDTNLAIKEDSPPLSVKRDESESPVLSVKNGEIEDAVNEEVIVEEHGDIEVVDEEENGMDITEQIDNKQQSDDEEKMEEHIDYEQEIVSEAEKEAEIIEDKEGGLEDISEADVEEFTAEIAHLNEDTNDETKSEEQRNEEEEDIDVIEEQQNGEEEIISENNETMEEEEELEVTEKDIDIECNENGEEMAKDVSKGLETEDETEDDETEAGLQDIARFDAMKRDLEAANEIQKAEATCSLPIATQISPVKKKSGRPKGLTKQKIMERKMAARKMVETERCVLDKRLHKHVKTSETPDEIEVKVKRKRGRPRKIRPEEELNSTPEHVKIAKKRGRKRKHEYTEHESPPIKRPPVIKPTPSPKSTPTLPPVSNVLSTASPTVKKKPGRPRKYPLSVDTSLSLPTDSPSTSKQSTTPTNNKSTTPVSNKSTPATTNKSTPSTINKKSTPSTINKSTPGTSNKYIISKAEKKAAKKLKKEIAIEMEKIACKESSAEMIKKSHHILKDHKSRGLYCNLCEKKCYGQFFLRHVVCVHLKHLPIYQCNLCEFGTGADWEIRTHMKNKHKSLTTAHINDRRLDYRAQIDQMCINCYNVDSTCASLPGFTEPISNTKNS